jgi:hypothetical protein
LMSGRVFAVPPEPSKVITRVEPSNRVLLSRSLVKFRKISEHTTNLR